MQGESKLALLSLFPHALVHEGEQQHIKPPTIRFVSVKMNINLKQIEVLLSLCAHVQVSV